MKPIIIANWKMQLGVHDTVNRLTSLRLNLKEFGYGLDVAVCPSTIALTAAKEILITSKIQLGAQDVFWEEKGAYTGETSPRQLQEVGVRYVIVGHSERREYLGETDSMVGQKVVSVLAHGMVPILCVGETAHQRNDNVHEMVIVQQLERALQSTTPPNKNQQLLVAYEPMWAIGTGEPASPAVADQMRQVIERTLIERFGAEIARERCAILYGGSVDAKNICDYVRKDSYDGALVGGASLDPESFSTLLQTVKDHCLK
jgi:triosephosphate isomerase